MLPFAPLPIQQREILPSTSYRPYNQLSVKVGKDRWRFSCQILKPDETPLEDSECIASISKNGRYIFPPTMPTERWATWGVYFKFSRPKLKSPFPIVAMRGSGGIGNHLDTKFFRIRNGRLESMGHAPFKNSNGPENWKGKSDHWIFDNYDWYSARGNPAFKTEIYLYRIDSGTGRLRFIRKWPSPGRRKLRDTVRVNF